MFYPSRSVSPLPVTQPVSDFNRQIPQVTQENISFRILHPAPASEYPQSYSIDDDHNFMRLLAPLKSAPS